MPNDTPDWTSVTQVETVPGSVVVTGPTMDELYHGRVTAGAPALVTFTAQKSYGYLIVSTDRYLTGVPPVAVRAYDTSLVPTAKTFAVPTFAAPLTRYTPTGFATSGRVGCANRPTDTVALALYGGSGQYTAWVYGVTGAPPFGIRGDGRNYPIGQYTAHAANTTPVIAAPTGPVRILLADLVLSGPLTASTAMQGNVKATVAGTARTLATVYATTTGSQPPIPRAWPRGLLCDAATAVVFDRGAGTTTGTFAVGATYDLVV